jgi:hypothetical protein
MTEGEDQRTVVVSGDHAEATACYWHIEGRNDYKENGFEIEAVVDRDGTEHEARWGDEPMQLFPGVTTYRTREGRHVRIARAACPVRVRMCEWFQYVSYDWADHNSSWSKRYWVDYVTR